MEMKKQSITKGTTVTVRVKLEARMKELKQ